MLKTPKSKASAPAAPNGINALLTAIDAHRDQIASLRQDRAQIESAPRPLADVLADLDAHLDGLATGAVDSLSLHHLRSQRGFSGLKLSQGGHPNVETATLLGLLAAVAREPLRQIIADQLADLDQARPGMTDADRTANLTEIEAAILKAELAEEYAIRQLERLGVQIGRRADAHPLAALASDDALAI